MTQTEKCEKRDDLEILESLKSKIYDAIMNDETIPKVGDLLKIIEMKNKMSVSGKGEKKFWDMIDQIRKEEFSKGGKKKKKSPNKKSKAN